MIINYMYIEWFNSKVDQISNIIYEIYYYDFKNNLISNKTIILLINMKKT